AYEQINILGDDGVPVTYHDRFWKSELIDFVLLQQDAFDKIDASTPLDRQKYMFEKVLKICHTEFEFKDFEQCIKFYKELINLFKQMNYSEYESETFRKYESDIEVLLANK
ncbi:MAG: V-type ATP synthase subunit A, partial [Bacteroidales bacterium]